MSEKRFELEVFAKKGTIYDWGMLSWTSWSRSWDAFSDLVTKLNYLWNIKQAISVKPCLCSYTELNFDGSFISLETTNGASFMVWCGRNRWRNHRSWRKWWRRSSTKLRKTSPSWMVIQMLLTTMQMTHRRRRCIRSRSCFIRWWKSRWWENEAEAYDAEINEIAPGLGWRRGFNEEDDELDDDVENIEE